MTQSKHIEEAKSVVKAAVQAETAKSYMSWTDVKTTAKASLIGFGNTFNRPELVVDFIAENSEVMKEIHFNGGSDETPLWELVRGSIPDFIEKRIADDIAELYAARFDADFDPLASIRLFGNHVANEWEQRAPANPIRRGQANTLRKQLSVDDLAPAVESLRLIVTRDHSLSTRYWDVLERVCDGYALRETFERRKTRLPAGTVF